MGKVMMIFTGGTISMKLDESQHAVVPGLHASEIMANLFTSELYPDLETFEFSEVPSPSITPAMMLSLANFITGFLVRDDVSGVVVVHGTDTLEETAFFLDIIVDSQKPIVVTGSMKSSSELGFDGINNLVSAILVAKSPKAVGKGCLVVLNDQINAASEVTKTNTLSLETFKSIDYGPLGIVDNKEVIFYRSVNYVKKHVNASTFVDRVCLLKVYAGMDSSLLNLVIDQLHAEGIVLEALGRGNVPPPMLDGIKKALSKNIPVVICSRCPSGRVLDTYGYVGGGKHLTDLGCILAPNLNGQKARILLMIALACRKDRNYLKTLFEK